MPPTLSSAEASFIFSYGLRKGERLKVSARSLSRLENESAWPGGFWGASSPPRNEPLRRSRRLRHVIRLRHEHKERKRLLYTLLSFYKNVYFLAQAGYFFSVDFRLKMFLCTFLDTHYCIMQYCKIKYVCMICNCHPWTFLRNMIQTTNCH